MIKQLSILGLLAELAAPLAGPAFAQDTMQKPDTMSHDAMKPNAMSSGAWSCPWTWCRRRPPRWSWVGLCFDTQL